MKSLEKKEKKTDKPVDEMTAEEMAAWKKSDDERKRKRNQKEKERRERLKREREDLDLKR